MARGWRFGRRASDRRPGAIGASSGSSSSPSVARTLPRKLGDSTPCVRSRTCRTSVRTTPGGSQDGDGLEAHRSRSSIGADRFAAIVRASSCGRRIAAVRQQDPGVVGRALNEGPDAMAVRIGSSSRRSDSRARGRPTARRGDRLAIRSQALAQVGLVLDLAEADAIAVGRVGRGRSRSRLDRAGRDRRAGPSGFARPSIPRAERTSAWRVFEQRVQVLPDDVGDQADRRRSRTGRRAGRACGSTPSSLRAAIATWSRTSGDVVAGQGDDLVADRGLDLCPGSRPRGRPRRGTSGSGRSSSRAWNAGSSGPAPTQRPQGVHPAAFAGPGRRGRVASSRGRLAASAALGQEPLGDVAVVDVRAAQPLDQLVVARLRQVEPDARGASPCSGRGRAGP